jgi:nucleotide-binding universal stress UspA family protein
VAERAIPHAEQFSRIFGAQIVLLRVLESNSHYENPDPIEPLSWQIHKVEADMYLHGIASRIQEHLHLPEGKVEYETTNDNRVEYVVREGRIAENIIDFAHNENIDLLIISSHGSGGLSRWNMSSIIQKVIDLVYLPLLIVRSHDLQGEQDDRIHYRNLLLPIDSSRRAESALSASIVLAQGEKLIERAAEIEGTMPGMETTITKLQEPKLILASVIRPPEIPIPAPYPIEIQKLSDRLLQVSRKAVLAYLREMKQRLPIESEIRVVENSNISSAIQELAEQENIDLVVMSAHGYSGQLTDPYGNVTRNSIERGIKSMLIIQDIPLSQVRLTVSAAAAENSGSR